MCKLQRLRINGRSRLQSAMGEPRLGKLGDSGKAAWDFQGLRLLGELEVMTWVILEPRSEGFRRGSGTKAPRGEGCRALRLAREGLVIFWLLVSCSFPQAPGKVGRG